MCKWNVFTIDRLFYALPRWPDFRREKVCHLLGGCYVSMSGRSPALTLPNERRSSALPIRYVDSLLDTVEKCVLVAERSGAVLLANIRARQALEAQGHDDLQQLNIFQDVLGKEPQEVFGRLESGHHEVEVEVASGEQKSHARVQWLPEPDWLIVQLEASDPGGEGNAATQVTVQELLQER